MLGAGLAGGEVGQEDADELLAEVVLPGQCCTVYRGRSAQCSARDRGPHREGLRRRATWQVSLISPMST